MNITQQGVIILLKSAVLQQSFPLPAGFDLDQAYAEAKQHRVTALLYEGAQLCGVSSQLPIMEQMFQDYCRSLIVSEGQMRQLYGILKAFDKNHIDYLLLKGCKLKALYPKSELRTMGDADILIRMEQYDSIVPIMESLGFRPGVESDHEFQWKNRSLFVELHKRLIPSYNKDFYAYFGDGWQLAEKADQTQYVMKPEDEMVYLFTHFAKHYRDGGIGCQHVLDLWMYMRENPDLNMDLVREKLERLQLGRFFDNILQLMAVWFEEKNADEKTDFITDFIFASGRWGTKENHVLSTSIRTQRSENGWKIARWTYALRLAFADVETLQQKYTILKKFPWMLPLVWIYRPLKKLFCAKERKTLAHHKKHLQMLSPQMVRTRHEALQYVGLEYHF